jgi:hypothetical protein
LAGAVLEGYSISTGEILLTFSETRWLTLAAHEGRVDWRLDTARATSQPLASSEFPVTLIWQGGRESIWDPRQLFEPRLRERFSEVNVGSCYIDLYFERAGALQFTPILNCDLGVPMVFVEELEPMN